jgi:predicted HTH domain antitoxin
MTITIAESWLQKANVSEDRLRLELALLLFREEAITLGQAAELSGLSQHGFQCILADRKVPVHYGEKEVLEDLETMKKLDL